MKRIKGGITAPVGFKAAAVCSGIKKDKLDLTLILSEPPATAAGMFTANSFKAAPVLLSKGYLKTPYHKAIIINSGNANCLTGKKGLRDAASITKAIGSLIGCKASQVLACSTGVIGKRLPVEKIKRALPALVTGLSRGASDRAAEAIMTTDTFKKEAAVSFNAGRRQVKIGGIAKGAGMIAPDMATMLCAIATDAKISKLRLKAALKEAVDNSFNKITVDGAMSTNDTVFIIANGLSGVDVAASGLVYKRFVSALGSVCLELAKMIVKDGEGATKFIEIEVKGAKDKKRARGAALSIANSPLFKTMCFGEDANFGRVAAACGASFKDINPSKVDIYLNDRMVVSSGVAVGAKLPQRLLAAKNIRVKVELNAGSSGAKVYTSDLTPQYISINTKYS